MDQSDPDMDQPTTTTTTTTPKLSLYSLPNQLPEPSGSASPPQRVSASVPFLWEEAPGKPRLGTTTEPDQAADHDERSLVMKSLELPPRLLGEVKFTNMSSPTTVLYGPEVGRSLSFTFSFRTPSESRKLSREKVGYFGSSRWGSFRKNKGSVVGGSFDILSSVHGTTTTSSSITNTATHHDNHDQDHHHHHDHGKVKITRVRRRGSLSSFSNAKSHLLASIYESFKQVVPWRRKQEKQRKMGSS
ncbi:uncharacterized protein At4g00950 [Humulus lupulus]|uniref:uncharacterized protein At4g00950 n=1 Tax=Humulus lupulus TaxID=3486 RepID=UPI002B412B7C|nr:uncharacterized protein At4g00950 [Humulus lupulus]